MLLSAYASMLLRALGRPVLFIAENYYLFSGVFRTIITLKEWNLQGGYIITIDLGGTKILSALINAGNEIIARVKVPTEVKSGKPVITKSLVESVNQIVAEGGITIEEVKAICIGIPGSVDPYTGLVGIAPNLKLKNFNIKAEMEKHFSIPILIENDVNLAALGIKEFELGDKGRNVLVTFIGTGIGGALLLENKLYRGSNYFAGEIGHITVDSKGPVCGCGKKGCLEALASRTAIARNIKKDIRNGKKSVLGEMLPRNKTIKSKALLQAIKKKDPVATKRITEACDTIGYMMGNITNILNLDMIILGGGVIEALDKFMLPKIKEAFKTTALKDTAKGVKIMATKLGDDAALYGGIALAREFLKEDTAENATA